MGDKSCQVMLSHCLWGQPKKQGRGNSITLSPAPLHPQAKGKRPEQKTKSNKNVSCFSESQPITSTDTLMRLERHQPHNYWNQLKKSNLMCLWVWSIYTRSVSQIQWKSWPVLAFSVTHAHVKLTSRSLSALFALNYCLSRANIWDTFEYKLLNGDIMWLPIQKSNSLIKEPHGWRSNFWTIAQYDPSSLLHWKQRSHIL